MNRKERRARGIDIGDAVVKYGGRTLELKVVINTDESLDEVVARVKTAAQGPGLRMCLVAGGEVDTERADAFWKGVIPHMKHEASKGGEA